MTIAALTIAPPPAITTKQLEPIVLREEQIPFLKGIYDQYRAGHRRILGVGCCGFGKTVISAKLVHDMTVKRNYKVLFLVHVADLVEQTIESFARHGLWAGAIAGGMEETRSKSIQVASLQTLEGQRGESFFSWFQPDFVIADECHESSWRNWTLKLFPKLKSGEAIFTASQLDNELRQLGFNIDAMILNGQKYPTWEEVAAQFKKSAMAAHPDHGGSKEAMQQLNEVWDTLKDHKDLFSGDRKRNAPTYIGLTATPWRLNKRQSMGDIFTVQVCGPTPGEMIRIGEETGFTRGLVPFVYWMIPGGENKSLKPPKNRDFTEAETDAALAIPEVVQCAVDNYKSKSLGRRFICFPGSIHHAQLLVHAFNKSGIPCALVEGKTPKSKRKDIYDAVRAKKLMGVASVNCISIGFDLPEIECVIDCAPTMSKQKYVQRAGRGQRLAPWIGKKECIYLDQAGNILRHGPIELIEYGDLTPAREIEPGEAPVKICPECGHIMMTFQTQCMMCGYEFPAAKKEMAVGDMVLYVSEKEEDLYKAFQELLLKAYQHNYAPYWAVAKINELYKSHPSVAAKQQKVSKGGKAGSWHPKKEWYYRAIFKKPTDEDKQAYLLYLQRCAAKYQEPKPQFWFDNYIKGEFGSC